MADDTMSLAALAMTSSAPKIDDDTPLACLSKPKASPSGKPVPVNKPLKRRASNVSSSSSSSSSSNSSGGSDAPLQKKKAAPKRKLGQKLGQRNKPALTTQNTMNTEDFDGGDDGGGAVKKRERSTKEDVVAALLCRWWYADEYAEKGWPPTEEEFYLAELNKRKYRKVTIQQWEWVPDVDNDGCKKVYELSQFRGVFRSSEGDLVDCRPKDTCPCFDNFMKKDLALLCQMLVSAYENQLKDLANCRYPSDKLQYDLKASITKTRVLLQSAMDMK